MRQLQLEMGIHLTASSAVEWVGDGRSPPKLRKFVLAVVSAAEVVSEHCPPSNLGDVSGGTGKAATLGAWCMERQRQGSGGAQLPAVPEGTRAESLCLRTQAFPLQS